MDDMAIDASTSPKVMVIHCLGHVLSQASMVRANQSMQDVQKWLLGGFVPGTPFQSLALFDERFASL
jgi:hypothetical protein